MSKRASFPWSDKALSSAFVEACRIEIQAFKPGNVSIWSEGHDMTVTDFHRSAECSVPALLNAELCVGERILAAVRATREAVSCNTNLGILLLCAPLLEAARRETGKQDLRERLRQVLASFDDQDAQAVFKAISVASPGGLGTVDEADVHQHASVPLLKAMALAEHRDRIARQFGNGFEEVFEIGCTAISDWLGDDAHPCKGIEWATVACYLRLMASLPDSHIARKFGLDIAQQVCNSAKEVEKQFKACKNSQDTVTLLHQFDGDMKWEGYNPGTCADLTVASLLAFKLSCSTSHHGSSAG